MDDMRFTMKKKVFSVLLILLIINFISGCASNDYNSDKNKEDIILISCVKEPYWMSAYVAYEMGYFAEEDLRVEFKFYDSDEDALQSMIAGTTQLCMISQEEVIDISGENKNVNILYSFYNTMPYGIASKNESFFLEDLKGEKIFTGNKGSDTYKYISYILKKAQLNAGSDVTFM